MQVCFVCLYLFRFCFVLFCGIFKVSFLLAGVLIYYYIDISLGFQTLPCALGSCSLAYLMCSQNETSHLVVSVDIYKQTLTSVKVAYFF